MRPSCHRTPARPALPSRTTFWRQELVQRLTAAVVSATRLPLETGGPGVRWNCHEPGRTPRAPWVAWLTSRRSSGPRRRRMTPSIAAGCTRAVRDDQPGVSPRAGRGPLRRRAPEVAVQVQPVGHEGGGAGRREQGSEGDVGRHVEAGAADSPPLPAAAAAGGRVHDAEDGRAGGRPADRDACGAATGPGGRPNRRPGQRGRAPDDRAPEPGSADERRAAGSALAVPEAGALTVTVSWSTPAGELAGMATSTVTTMGGSPAVTGSGWAALRQREPALHAACGDLGGQALRVHRLGRVASSPRR